MKSKTVAEWYNGKKNFRWLFQKPAIKLVLILSRAWFCADSFRLPHPVVSIKISAHRMTLRRLPRSPLTSGLIAINFLDIYIFNLCEWNYQESNRDWNPTWLLITVRLRVAWFPSHVWRRGGHVVHTIKNGCSRDWWTTYILMNKTCWDEVAQSTNHEWFHYGDLLWVAHSSKYETFLRSL